MRVGRRCFLMAQRSSGYGQFAWVGAFRKVTASVAFAGIVRIRDRAIEQRERIGGDAAFGRAPVGARTNDRTADGSWVVQQTDRPPIEYRSRDSQVACEKHLLETDGPDPGPRGLSSIGTRPHLSVGTDQIVTRPVIRPASARKPIGLALQGGGSWGAYTWGVLDALLASRSITITQLSGTSAGALNAAIIASALANGSPAQARKALRSFWMSIAAPGAPEVVRSFFGPLERLWRNSISHCLLASVLMSPYRATTLGLHPLREAIPAHVDISAIRTKSGAALFLTIAHG